MCKVFRQVSLVTKVELSTGFRIGQRVVVIDKQDTVFFTACFQALAVQFQCVDVVTQVNSGQAIVFHAASEDVDVCGAVMAYNRKIFDEGF